MLESPSHSLFLSTSRSMAWHLHGGRGFLQARLIDGAREPVATMNGS